MFKYSKVLIGVAFILAGVVATINPEWVSATPLPDDVYEAVEQRALWGMLIGFGAMLLVHHSLLPWPATVVGLLATVPFGVTLARLIAIALEGAVSKNWLWVFVDGALFLALYWWYRWLKARESA